MKGQYIQAIETRAKWLGWSHTNGYSEWESIYNLENLSFSDTGKTKIRPFDDIDRANYLQAFPNYKRALENGDSYFMNREFCELVEHAKLTVPDDLCFENSWVQSRAGFLWLETPFEVPISQAEFDDTSKLSKLIHIRAVGWLPKGDFATHFMCYISFDDYGRTGFGCWSYFTLTQGDSLKSRILQFEQLAKDTPAEYVPSDKLEKNHEMRWIYTAVYLMAQRLSHLSNHAVDRHTRRRAEREKLPITPFIRVISLRRLEEDKEKEGSRTVDWQWQWTVRGHWRNQPYGDGSIRPIFIEAYVKGPENMPLKPPGHNLFLAVR